MKKHNTSKISISFIFCFSLAVISFLTVYSPPAPACISSWLWASVFCLIKISYQVVNEAIYELLSFWVNRPLIVIGKRQIHIWLSVQLAVCACRGSFPRLQMAHSALQKCTVQWSLPLYSSFHSSPGCIHALRQGFFSLFLIFLD